MKRRIMALILSFIMLIGMLPTEALADTITSTAWDGTTVTEPQKDRDGVYQIGTAEELAWFAGLINGTLDDVEQNMEASAVLTGDIDLNNQAWTPIGNMKNSNIFKGKFDGKEYAISGLNVPGNTYSTNNMYTGLFGNACGATISNLTIKGKITAKGSFVGGIAGKAYSKSKIENCVSYVNITVEEGTNISCVGGIAGNLTSATVENCINYGDVSSLAAKTGGIAGILNSGSNAKNCGNNGMIAVSGCEYTGGIAGSINSYSDEAKISDCYNTGMVISNGSKTAGIVGSIETAKVGVVNSYNLGTVIGTAGKAAGLAGFNAGTIEKSYTVGSLKLAGSDIGNVVGKTTGTIKDCCYLEGMYTGTDTNGTSKSADDMNAEDFVTTLGDGFKKGCTYPILSWQKDGTHAYDESTGKCTCTGCTKEAEHVWKDATCTKPMTCTMHNETRGKKLGHIYVEEVCIICGKNVSEQDPFEIRLSENTDVLSVTELEKTKVKDDEVKHYFVSLDKNVTSLFVTVSDEKYTSACTSKKDQAVGSLNTTGTTLELTSFATGIDSIVNDTSVYDTTSNDYYAIVCANSDLNDYFYIVVEMPKKVEKVTPTEISLPEESTVYVGDKITLSPTFTPENADTDLEWSIVDESIATVDTQGGVLGKTVGTTTITATSKKDSTVKASTRLTVSSVNKYDVDWAGTFNNRYDNNSVSSVKLPASASNVTESWSTVAGNSTIAVVGDYIYTYACSQGMSGFDIGGKTGTFYKINKTTGEVVKTVSDNKGKGGFYYGYTIYGGKYIYVSCPNGVMAFDPDTCVLVWENIAADKANGTVNMVLDSHCCAQYVNGYVVVNGMVYDADNGTLVKDLEGDYNYSSGAIYGKYFYVADYHGILYAFDTINKWEKIDSLTFKTDGSSLQPGVLYYNGKLYWGDAIKTNIYSVALKADGTLNKDTLVTTESGYTTVCTPVAYGNRIYLAGQLGSYGGDGYVGVYSADDLHMIYKTPKEDGVTEIKSTPILYADEKTDTVYLWMQTYGGDLYCLTDTPMTTSGSVKKLITPSTWQYAFEQIACDKEGALYATNNSGTLFKFVTADIEVPTFTTDLSEDAVSYVVGTQAEALNVAVTANGEGKVSYQWQKSTDKTNWSNIEGATKASYTPATKEKSETYYRCVATNTEGGKKASAISKAKLVSVINESELKIKVSFRLIGATKSNDDVDFETNPGNYYGSNYETWIGTTTYELRNGTTLGELFEMVMEDAGLSYKGLEKDYISAITKDGFELGEFDNGTYSGWMYTVNGKHPVLGLNTCRLGDGDVVVWHYVNDYRFEDESSNPTSSYLNKWMEAADKAAIDTGNAKVDAVEKLIESIGTTITSDSKAAIEKARAAYDKLVSGRKKLVDNYDILVAAEKVLAALEEGTHTHTWDAGKITKAATCTTAGTKTYTCSCGETKTETIKATGHSYGEWVTTSAATVFAAEVQRHTCTACGVSETKDVGSKLKATMKVTASTVTLKMKQKTNKFKVTGLAKGDAVKKYESSNKKIFTVTQKGVITAGKKVGRATLTITLKSGLKKKVTVKVQKKAVAATKITGLKSKVTLKKGKKLTLKPTVKPFTCVQKVTYQTSNKKIATVTSKGVIKGKKAGTAKITVKCGKKKFTVKVTVK